jgi:hypothetical protein
LQIPPGNLSTQGEEGDDEEEVKKIEGIFS